MSDFNINEDAQSGGECSGSQTPTESAFPDEDEDTITMLDVIEREDKLEEEASAVLGNSDEKNCTYPKGYISRQALYSCATCSDGPDKQAAICLACALECHDNHEVYELYTKRNYRCDCGNSKFRSDFECKLMDKHQKKATLNEQNKYNHNFVGRYCICDKRYPPDENDDSAESQDEMWQCIVCEDWYHSKHLGAKELPTKFEELICGPCVEKLDFVRYYKNIDMKPVGEHADGESEDDVKSPVSEPKTSFSTNNECHKRSVDEASTHTESSKSGENSETANCESDTNDSQAENKDPKQEVPVAVVKNECILEGLKNDYESNQPQDSGSTSQNNELLQGPLFWSDCDWRAKLCRCQKCMEMYKVKDCEYLLDDKDTVQYYEAQGKAIAKNSETPFERGMSALNRMNRTAVVEALHGYDELKEDLRGFLKSFATSKKVVREEDIHEFFSQLKSKKRPRLEYE